MFRQVDMRKKNLMINATVGLSFFLFTFLTLTGLQVFNFSHATTDIAAVVTQTGYYINTASSSINNSITLSVDATPAGAMAMAKDTINVKSNAPNGYSVYLSMADSTGCVSNCNALKNDEYKIDATTGTFANPVNLAVNTWGYAIKNNTTGAPTNGFSNNYNEAVPDESTLWAALPEKGEDQLVQTINEPDNTDGINLDIFYGAKVDTSLPSGVYRGEITYTAISHDATGVVDIALVSPTTTEKLEGGERMTISTEYNFESENLGEVKVYMNSLTTSKECTNVSATIENEKLKITCDAPAYNTGKYDVRVVIPGYSKDITMAKAVSYVVDSADAKDIATTMNAGFDSTNLNIDMPACYYGGDTVPLSDLMSTFTQDYDSTKTAEQNTQDAGITYTDTTIEIAEGYHKAQSIPKPASQAGFMAQVVWGRWKSAQNYNIGSLISNNGYNIDCHKLTNGHFLYAGSGAQRSGGDQEYMGVNTGLSYNASNCILTATGATEKDGDHGSLFMNGYIYMIILNPASVAP